MLIEIVAITKQKLRNDHHLHNYVKIMLRCERFSKVMNILMVPCILITSHEHFDAEERGKRMQEGSSERGQMDCEHVTQKKGKIIAMLVHFVSVDVLC